MAKRSRLTGEIGRERRHNRSLSEGVTYVKRVAGENQGRLFSHLLLRKDQRNFKRASSRSSGLSQDWRPLDILSETLGFTSRTIMETAAAMA